MILGRKYVRAAVFYGLFVLVTGGLVLQNMHSEAVAEGKPGAAEGKPVVAVAPDECYESMKGATNLARVDNAVPKFGYPNVKCSPTTGAVLWYGDPYYGTVPMGDMPHFGDETDGDFAQAKIRPRAESLKTTMQCSACHPSADPAVHQNDPREIMNHQDIVSDATKLQHGRGAIWCFDCHNAAYRDTLVDRRGNEVSFNESY
ncbi:MAG: hypothetical protein D3903_00280 [Candidatus Electrothrix sp. GM3_4]|nr:hypothetical protein [Candidatus Electrothrix sp. GM3_4]